MANGEDSDRLRTMNLDAIELRRIDLLGDEITPLVIEAESEGHRFMRRLRDEWDSGENRFQRSGEFLLSAVVDRRLMAVGGLNSDPYSSAADVGRLRHVYVSSDARRLGVGTILVSRIMECAAQTFSTLRLRTTTADPAAFYERLGFVAINEEAATHVITLHAS